MHVKWLFGNKCHDREREVKINGIFDMLECLFGGVCHEVRTQWRDSSWEKYLVRRKHVILGVGNGI